MSLASWIRRKLGQSSAVETPEKILLSEIEFVLLDVDLTGTDASRDHVVGLAALPLSDGLFRPDALRYCRFPQPAPAETGPAPEMGARYRAILDLMAGRPVFTINPVFVRHMLERAAVQHCLPPPVGKWLDLSAAAGVVGSDAIPATSLKHWQEKMKACGRHEHDAVYDVFAMAQLLQALLAYAEDTGIETLADLMRNQTAEAWLRPY